MLYYLQLVLICKLPKVDVKNSTVRLAITGNLDQGQVIKSIASITKLLVGNLFCPLLSIKSCVLKFFAENM